MEEEEELTEQQKQRKAQVQFEAQHYIEEDWDAIRAKLKANVELTKNVLGKEFPEEDFAKKMVELVNQRKKFFAEERDKARRKELQTEILKKQRIDDKYASVEEKVTEVKEEEPVIRIGKGKKQKARKGINVDKSPQGDSETDEEELVEAMNPTPLDTKSNSGSKKRPRCLDRKIFSVAVAKEMWTAIKRLQQGESLNIQDVKTNLFWEFRKFTSRDGESMESYYSRFYKLMNELKEQLASFTNASECSISSTIQTRMVKICGGMVKQRQEMRYRVYHKAGLDVLKQFQNEIILSGTKLKSNAPSYKQSSSTRSTATTRHKGKEIAKPVTPQSESVSEEDSDPEQARRDKDMQKNLALLANTEDTTPRYNNDNQSRQFGNQRTVTVAGARETVGSPVVQKTGIQCFNCKGFGHYARECRKPKRVKDYAYHKEKMMMCKQAEQGVPFGVEQEIG
ncbi:retrovirus-related pol polyprotein from transposon TNT 1-94 [Tanacetum coccineum]